MCNLLVPICPFILHSVNKLPSITHKPETNDQDPSNVTDAKILFAYLSKRPWTSNSADSNQTKSQSESIPLNTAAQAASTSVMPPRNSKLSPSGSKTQSPKSKPPTTATTDRETNSLYRRTTWHTCPCFFHRVSVMHPYPGPSRAAFGPSAQWCRRCSEATKLLKPMRMGGMKDLAARSDRYWERVVFLGAEKVFDRPTARNEDVEKGDAIEQRGKDSKRSQQGFRNRNDGRNDRGSRPHEEGDIGGEKVGRRKGRGRGRFEEDLDRYLRETYPSEYRIGELRR